MPKSATEKTESIFKSYEKAATELVGDLTKTRAIQLNEHRFSEGISLASIHSLYESLAGADWTGQTGKNWIWRDRIPDYSKTAPDKISPEVSLEREVASLDLTKWTCQMSTSSGVQNAYLNKRRAIDLVRDIGDGEFAFIELKVGSDNPLYATFEILGYALAYLHARANRWQGTEAHDVFSAKSIELTILGPESWYKYIRRGSGEEQEFDLKWLTDQIARSLNELVSETFKGGFTFSMEFRRFSGAGNVRQQALEIHGLAADSWWKD